LDLYGARAVKIEMQTIKHLNLRALPSSDHSDVTAAKEMVHANAETPERCSKEKQD